jgi:hypothetical protein
MKIKNTSGRCRRVAGYGNSYGYGYGNGYGNGGSGTGYCKL